MVLFYNALIVREGETFLGWLLFNPLTGLIEDVGYAHPAEELLADASIQTHDLKRKLLLPGVIDTHVHFREPGLIHKATIRSESRAAAAGGVTSYLEMPNTNPATTTIEAWEDKMNRAATDSLVNYAFFIGATQSNLPTLQKMDYTRCPGVKLFMGSSTGGMLVEGKDSLEGIFKLSTIVMAHCEDEQTIRENMRQAKALYDPEPIPLSMHPEVRSALACLASTKRAVSLALANNTRLHIAHISTSEELDFLRFLPQNITCEVCVPHLLFSDEDYYRLGSKIKCNPAVKSRRHLTALRNAYLEGHITTVATDHAPHTREEKTARNLSAPSGMPMVQFSLPAMMTITGINTEDEDGLIGIERLVSLMSERPARLFRIDRRGVLRKGNYADLVVYDPAATTHVGSDTILSQCGWSPLEGKTLNGRVESTWVNGQCVYTANEGIRETKAAQPLHFQG